MDETEVKIVDAALDAFSRHGLRRVSMADIAEAAEVSRPTLYARFRNKDEVFAACMRVVFERTTAQMQAEWAQADGVGEVIDIYYSHAIIGPYRTMQAHPDVTELLNGVGPATQVAADGLQVWCALLETYFAPFKAHLAAQNSSPAAVAEMLAKAAKQFKLSAPDEAVLQALLLTLKQSTLAMIGQHAGRE